MLADILSTFHVLPNTEKPVPNTKSVSVFGVWCASVQVGTCVRVDLSCQAFVIHLLPAARHQVGKGFSWRDGNRSPIRPISARTLID